MLQIGLSVSQLLRRKQQEPIKMVYGQRWGLQMSIGCLRLWKIKFEFHQSVKVNVKALALAMVDTDFEGIGTAA